MKKGLLFLITALLVCLCAAALSEVSGPVNLAIRFTSIQPRADAFACQMDGEQYYRLVDGKGNVIVSESARYTNMFRMSACPYFKVEVKSADGVHNDGLIDAAGKVIIPAQYADIKVINDRWQVGIKLTPSSAEDKDYTFTNWDTDAKTFYRIDTADIYFDGALAGTLNRNEYGEGSYTAYGAYLQIRDIEKQYRYYNSKLEMSPYENSGMGEYDSVYANRKTTIYHRGTGQIAFAESCTLNPEDLDNPYRYDSGVMYDIRGNVLFRALQNYDWVQQYKGDYAVAQMNRKWGLIDKAGNEVIPLEYDSLGSFENRFLECGYISAVRDGKFGFLDANGNVTCDFVYAENIVRNYTPFATVKNLDGTIIVLSAAAGELPEHYAEVYFPSSDSPMGFVGVNGDGQKCVVDLYGKTVIPYSDEYSNIEINNDLSVILCQRSYREYDLYSRDTEPAADSPSKATEIKVPSFEDVFVPADPIPDLTLAPVQVEIYWTCENGHEGNTGKFCAECGLPKPEPTPTVEPAEGPWTCENGHEGNTGNFCTECGAPKPVAEAGPWTCENGHGGNTGKFCAECGLPRPGTAQNTRTQPTDPPVPQVTDPPIVRETSAPAAEPTPAVIYTNPFPRGFERFSTPLTGTFIDHKIALDELISHSEPGDETYMTQEEEGVASDKLAWMRYGNDKVKLYLLYHPDKMTVYAYCLAVEYPVSQREAWAKGELSPSELNTVGSVLWVESGENNDRYKELLNQAKDESDYETAKKLMRNPNLAKSCKWFSHRLTYFREELTGGTDRYWLIFHNTPD